MYAGALYYVIGGSLALIFVTGGLLIDFFRPDYDIRLFRQPWFWRPIMVLFSLSTTFLASWLFWAGFVQLAGDLSVLYLL